MSKKQIQCLLLTTGLEMLANTLMSVGAGGGEAREESNAIWNVGQMCHVLQIVILYLENKWIHWKTFINIEDKIQ